MKVNNSQISEKKLSLKSDNKRFLQEATVDWKFLGKVTSIKYQK